MDSIEQKVQALGFFKDWTNYLLVTTVAALGWAASEDGVLSDCLRRACVWSFALSIVFAILTLALVPAIAEQIDEHTTSIYEVGVKFRRYWFWGDDCTAKAKLRWFCFAQHVLFLSGVILYARGRQHE